MIKSDCLQEHTLTYHGREDQERLGGLGQIWDEFKIMCVSVNTPLSEHQLYVRHYIIHLYYLC